MTRLQYSCVLFTQTAIHMLYYTDHKMLIGYAFILNSEKQQATCWKVRLALRLLFTAKRWGSYLCTSPSLAVQVSALKAASYFLVYTARLLCLLVCAYMPESFTPGASSFNMLRGSSLINVRSKQCDKDLLWCKVIS